MKDTPRRVWLARHAERQDQADPSWASKARHPHDPDISEKGIFQAKSLAARMAPEKVDHIFCSPFLRTVHTASYCAEQFDLPIRAEDGLGEQLLAEWFPHRPVLHPADEVRRRFPRLDAGYKSHVSPPHPESDGQPFIDRCGAAADHALRNYPGNILFVMHFASCNGVLQSLIKRPLVLYVELCSVSELVHDGAQWQLVSMANAEHWGPTWHPESLIISGKN